MKLKTYKIYKAGSEQIGTITAPCITKAATRFMDGLDRPASFELDSRKQATVRYADNHCILSDFVIIEA